jgi:hypothetical protein
MSTSKKNYPEELEGIFLRVVFLTYCQLIKRITESLLILRGIRFSLTEFMDFLKLRNVNKQLSLEFFGEFSFQFPRVTMRIFTYNEFITRNFKTA